ncbi:hypothetical protein [Devosia sp. A449]
MAETKIDALLARMAEIAEAVNSFSSPDVQRAAFDALLAALGGLGNAQGSSPKLEKEDGSTVPQTNASGNFENEEEKKPKRTTTRKNNGQKKDFKFIRDLDLRPNDKKPFEEFAAEKQPKSNEDKYVVAVYYLQHILELPAVTADHVGSVFRLTSTWREPKDVAAGLRVAGSRKGTIDTSMPANLRVTPTGRNFVEHDLPPSTKSKK